MRIRIEAEAKKGIFRAPVTGEIRIDIPLAFLLEKRIRKRIIATLGKLTLEGLILKGYATVDGERVELGGNETLENQKDKPVTASPYRSPR